jgi:hypothetical protein
MTWMTFCEQSASGGWGGLDLEAKESEAMETVGQAVDRFTGAGWTEQFRAEPEGLRALRCGRVLAAADLVVDEVFRAEGITNPDDEAAVFALHAADDEALRGTYTVAYGPGMDSLDAEWAMALSSGSARERRGTGTAQGTSTRRSRPSDASGGRPRRSTR